MFQKLKKAFGLYAYPDTEENPDLNGQDTDGMSVSEQSTEEYVTEKAEEQENSLTEEETAEPEKQEETTAEAARLPALAGRIFDGTIEFFNRCQPDFVRQCLDSEAQRNYLIETIAHDLRETLAEITGEARREGEAQAEAAIARAAEEIAARETRRADLEASIRRLEETAGNLASVAAENLSLKEEITRLKKENSILTQKAEIGGEVSLLLSLAQEDAATSRADLSALRKESEALRNSLEASRTEITALRGENASLRRSLDEKSSLLAAAPTEAEASRRQLEEILRKQFDEQIERLRADSRATLSAVSAERDAITEKRDALLQRNGELEEIRRKRDVMVAEANARSNRLATENEKQAKENEATIAGLLKRIADLEESEKGARELYEAAKASLAELTAARPENQPIEPKRRRGRPRNADRPKAPTPPEAPLAKTDVEEPVKGYVHPDSILNPEQHAPVREEATVASKRKVKPTISAIDELLDGSDWLESPSPPARHRNERHQKPRQDDDDFGYRAPVRKPIEDDDSQMRLW